MDDPFFAEFLRKSKDNGATAGIFLLVDGVCVTGLMASDARFTTQTNETIDSLPVAPSEEVEPQQVRALRLEGPLDQSEHYINLRDAKIISGIGERTMPMTRIDLRHVSGWGVLETAQEDDRAPSD